MIQVFAHLRNGRFLIGSSEDAERSKLTEWPEDISPVNFQGEFEMAWFDIEDPTADELAWLSSRFHFHPLAIEDCAHFDQRPKLEEYADHLFLVLHGLKADRTQKCVEVYELHAFLAKNAVVTVHQGQVEPLEALKRKISRDRNQMPLQVDFLLHKVLDVVMDDNPKSLACVEGEIELLDEEISQQARGLRIEKIHALQLQLTQARHVMNPQREIFRAIINHGYAEIGEKATIYFRDIYDHLIVVTETIDRLRENLWGIRDAYLAMSAHRSNEAMKRLTVFSVVFLPLTFITGFFGMNFTQIPWGSPWLFLLVVVCVLALPVGMIFWFRGKDWI